jgi:hypothetical protein
MPDSKLPDSGNRFRATVRIPIETEARHDESDTKSFDAVPNELLRGHLRHSEASSKLEASRPAPPEPSCNRYNLLLAIIAR